MIRKEEVFKIGVINKPHGVKGEVSFTFTDDIFDRVDCDYLILLMDGILVPFFMEEYRFRSDNVALVKFEDIDTAEQARKFTNVEVYFPKKFMDEQEDARRCDFMEFLYRLPGRRCASWLFRRDNRCGRYNDKRSFLY